MKLKILGIASLALLAAGCSQQEPPAQPLRTVRVMQIDAAAVSGSLTFPGEVRARHESRLAFRIGGKIIERRVDVGAAVKRGQRLDESTPGSGLGLSIVTDLADAYGGKLRLDRSALGGLKSVLKLPGGRRDPKA